MVRLGKALLKFPPDLTLGYEPTNYQGFRMFVGLMHLLKNIIPMIVLQQFQETILSEEFTDIPHLLKQMVGVLPVMLLLLTIFPLNAAIVKLDRYWQNYLTLDLSSHRYAYYQSDLPLEDHAYDIFNNRMDILNKIFYYGGFGAIPVSFTLPFPDALIFLGLGLILFAIQGYQSGWWLDIQNRVKVKTIFQTEELMGSVVSTVPE